MKSKKGKWLFFGDDSRMTPLNGEQVAYWLNLLPKIIKIGVEFEFNLTEQKGMCDGSNPDCDCIYIERGCGNECARKEDCETIKIRENCANRMSPVCTTIDCESCGNFRLDCPQLYCVAYHPQCAICDDFRVNCDDCEKKYNKKLDPKNVRAEIKQILSPTNSWGLPGANCIAEVTTDGSLRGDKGVEIVTVGRRLEFKSFFEMCKNAIDAALKRRAYCDERTSIHLHVLTAYYRSLNKTGKERGENPMNTNELEQPLPELVLANFHQLVRRYQNALTWMSMGLDNGDTLTRWEKYRGSVLPFSPYLVSMNRVKNEIMSQYKDYGFVNYDNCRFHSDGSVRTFHFEMRHMDNIPCPSIVTAKAILIYAMVIKAIEISRYGLLEVGDKDWMDQATKMKKTILNNCPTEFGSNRFSTTTDVMKYGEQFRDQSVELLSLVKRTLIEFGPQVYDQLLSLAERPVCFRRIDGQSWEEIEADFFVPLREEEEINHVIRQIVDLQMFLECKSLTDWFTLVWREMKGDFPQEVSKNIMMKYVKGQIAEGKLQWSEPLGTVI
jgi:hypothetical protein